MLLAYIIFISALFVVLYTYALYPAVLFFMGLFRRSRRVVDEEYIPAVALIISVYNEEKVIKEKIENSLQIDYPEDRLKIIVASDGSTDDTNDIVRSFDDRRIILKAFEKREGKSATLNKAVLGIEDDVIVFSDANAFYEKNAIRKLVRNLADERVGCVVGRLIYLTNHSYVGKGEGLYWKYESMLNRLESKLGSVLVATGTIFAVRRTLLGPILKDVANDFQLPAIVASRGYEIVFEPDAVAYEKPTYFFKEEFNRKRRIIVRGLTGFYHLRSNFGGRFRVFQFVSRKLIRWWIGPILPLLYVSNIFLLKNPFFLAIFVLQNVFYLLALIGAVLRRGEVQSRLLFIPFYFVMVNTASFAAIFTYLAGSRLTSWEKAETTRVMTSEDRLKPEFKVIEGKKKFPDSSSQAKKVKNLERIT